jgi:hypothetical protein
MAAIGGLPKTSALGNLTGFWGRLLVLALLCLPAVSCDLPPGWGDAKGALTIVLPGAGVPDPAARAVRLPEPVTGNMNYTLGFYKAGESLPVHSIGPTRERVITLELEPGFWDIAVTARYGGGTAITGADKKDRVEIRAGQTNSLSFTMNADEFITPDRVEGPLQEMTITTSDAPPVLSLTMNTSTAFSNISGWTDQFSYQWYYEDEAGGRTDGPGGSFSGPGARVLDCPAANDTAGTFRYYVEITNRYTYRPPRGGTITSDSAVKIFHVAELVVNAALVDIEITWPREGDLP